MLMLSGFFLTKEPHIHTLVESWTWSWDCCGHGQTEWETLYQKGTQTRQRRLVVSLWMCLIQVKPALGIGKTYELRLGGRGSRRGCYPPHLAKIWQRLSVALFDLERNLILTPVSSISRYLPAPQSLDHQNTLADLRPDQGLNFLMLQQSKQLPCKILRPWWPCSSSLQFVDLFWPPLLLGA